MSWPPCSCSTSSTTGEKYDGEQIVPRSENSAKCRSANARRSNAEDWPAFGRENHPRRGGGQRRGLFTEWRSNDVSDDAVSGDAVSHPTDLSGDRHRLVPGGQRWLSQTRPRLQSTEGRGALCNCAQLRRYKNKIRIKKPTTYPTYAFKRP